MFISRLPLIAKLVIVILLLLLIWQCLRSATTIIELKDLIRDIENSRIESVDVVNCGFGYISGEMDAEAFQEFISFDTYFAAERICSWRKVPHSDNDILYHSKEHDIFLKEIRGALSGDIIFYIPRLFVNFQSKPITSSLVFHVKGTDTIYGLYFSKGGGVGAISRGHKSEGKIVFAETKILFFINASYNYVLIPKN